MWISGARVTAYTFNGLFAGPTMLINPGDRIKLTLFHCHILGHEDLGMMKTIQAYKDPRSSRTVALRSPAS